MADFDQIKQKIASAKNYKGVYFPTISRIVDDVATKYPKNTVENVARRRLHQICGIYSNSKQYEKYLNDLCDAPQSPQALLKILETHSSTRERLNILDDFYAYIFSKIGDVKTIIEPACGMNPLTYPFMKTNARYTGYDIDSGLINFVQKTLKPLNLEDKIHVESKDIYEDMDLSCDACFLFKLVPLLEQQKKGSTEELLSKIKAKFIVVTFPTKSIGNNEKGMEKFYSEFFEGVLNKLNLNFEKKSFENELVYVTGSDPNKN